MEGAENTGYQARGGAGLVGSLRLVPAGLGAALDVRVWNFKECFLQGGKRGRQDLTTEGSGFLLTLDGGLSGRPEAAGETRLKKLAGTRGGAM